MPSLFETAPSPYHLGTCNAPVQAPDGTLRDCGQPAVERAMSQLADLLGGDWRRCEEHARASP